MPKTTLTCDAWKCSRCGYKWLAKNSSKPIRCAKCGSPYWDKEKVTEENDKQL